MRRFLSPGERRLLETLPPDEAAVLRALIDELGARLDPADEPPAVGSMQLALDLAAPWGRRAA